MVQVTDRAVIALQNMLTDTDAPPEAGIRLTPNDSGGVGMTVDAPVPGDEVIERDESCVLIVDGAIRERMTEMVVDYQSSDLENGQTGDGRFVLRPPQGGD